MKAKSRGEVRVYKDDKEDGFENSGLPDEMQDAYDDGWNEGMSQDEQFSNMTPEEYERKLGEQTTIVNFNGLMTLFEKKEYNGKMTDYVVTQIQYGYAPPDLGIGYEVNLVDWIQNPNPEEYERGTPKLISNGRRLQVLWLHNIIGLCIFVRKISKCFSQTLR